MVRRALPLASLATAALAASALGGCGYGTPARLSSAQEQARVRFIEGHPKLTDRQLARLCPGLYPRNFLTDTKKYPLAKQDKDGKAAKVTAADRAQAKAAGCDVRA